MKNWAPLLLLSMIGGGTFLGIEIALEGFNPIWLAAIRITIASALMLAVWSYTGFRLFEAPVNPKSAGMLVSISLLSTVVPFSLISWGQQYVTSGFASIAVASTALMVAPLAHVFVPDERFRAQSGLGLLLGFLGVVILLDPGAVLTPSFAGGAVGKFACLAAASCYAAGSIVVRLLPPISQVGLVAVVLTLGAALILPAAFFLAPVPAMPGLKPVVAITALAVLSTCGSNLLGVWIIRSAGPTFMAYSNYLTPAFAITFGAVFLRETVTREMIVGFALVAIGLSIVQIQKVRDMATCHQPIG